MRRIFLINPNNIKKVIPKRPKINGREEFVKTSVLVLLIKKNNDWHIVYEKRALNISQGGEISFAGGKFDKSLDITAEDTAVREAEEELGINKEDIEVLGELDTIITPIGVVVKPFLAISEIDESTIRFNKSEVEYTFSIPLSWLFENKPEEYHIILKAHPTIVDKAGKEVEILPSKKLNLPERYHNPWGRLKQKIYVYKYKEETIWGLTAAITNSLIKSLVQYKEL